ncbi:hypothetical protein [Parafrankia sp. EUN1f]|uniref:hypothetical protein n=1 Tax=Parafrankia sp. EUN1f TaxID=102897 RepID=UPI0001C46CFA|nr:hypothetical protein [Parafrankia sp. EUN1f]EFC80169.1 hypothetical protein FrEUN1fDRAFT_6698 [Parafrankia sp. EUN1f]
MARSQKPPDELELLGRFSIGLICADDVIRDSETGRYYQHIDRDDDGGRLLALKGKWLDSGEPAFLVVRKTCRFNIYIPT